eukprot:CAMPEP_0119554560 /NCGR_PEP_ID=MMETSP1352-20130426/7021_1 /TAXON_ID=265584 /ORGANISM="Stauroneis constricta, Strain CCMP1120" /LENGTH=626 /DNA_ID=CAMNT_0007601173 /DNA_START=28 /DNA_END=1908 /DNA_ORIENTATION=+
MTKCCSIARSWSLLALAAAILTTITITPISGQIHAESFARAYRNLASTRATDVDLPWGDINVLVLTDVHSWIAGHGRHESNMDADYGDILSFYQKLKEYANFREKDLFFVMNGDFMDGTGLSTTPPQHLTPLLEHMEWDVVNLGNHELYDNQTVEWVANNFVPHWKGNYLTSNTVLTETGKPIGNRYTYLYGKHSNSTILSFGFLYNFKGNCKASHVETVQDVVRQEWFINVLSKENYDAILVMAHMHVTDPLVDVIRIAIRNVVGNDMPIQFMTGHSHIRSYKVLDDFSASFEAGKFLDTVGFASFPKKGTTPAFKHKDDPFVLNRTEMLFPHVYMDTNRRKLADLLHVEALPTPAGMMLSDKIHQTQEMLSLMEKLGCASHTFPLKSGLDEPFSLWGLYLTEVIPAMLTQHDKSTIFVQSTGGLRYSLFEGNVVLDDVVSVTPFNDTVYKIGSDVSGSTLLQMLHVTHINEPQVGQKLPKYGVSCTDFDANNKYDILTAQFDSAYLHNRLQTVTGLPVPPPQPIHSKTSGGGYVKTTKLWVEYIKTYWPCRPFSSLGGHPLEAASPDTIVVQEEKPLATAIFISLVVLGVWMHSRQADRRRGYRQIGEMPSPMKIYGNAKYSQY